MLNDDVRKFRACCSACYDSQRQFEETVSGDGGPSIVERGVVQLSWYPDSDETNALALGLADFILSVTAQELTAASDKERGVAHYQYSLLRARGA